MIAMPLWLLAVGRKKIREPRTHVAGHVLHNAGDGICFRIEGNKQLFILKLCDCSFGEALVAAKLAADFVEVMSSDVIAHG